jgi:tRNA pseudouridine55 synthase
MLLLYRNVAKIQSVRVKIRIYIPSFIRAFHSPPMPFQNAILLLDKPLGLSSNAALQKVRWLLGKPKPKAGHTGTLDPLATGMLPICLGEATKFAGYLLSESKRYRTRVALGLETASGDRDGGEVAVAELPILNESIVHEVLARFVGHIRQTPPIYSAIKQDGIPLYKLARAGEAVTAKEREVRVDRIELVALGVDFLDLEIDCGSGTYIRTLGMDIARALGTVGHLAQLHRVWVAPFQTCAMASITDVTHWCDEGRSGQPPWLLPIEQALLGMPLIVLDADATLAVKQGRIFSTPGEKEGSYRLHDPDDLFFGLGQVDGAGVLRAKRLLAT